MSVSLKHPTTYVVFEELQGIYEVLTDEVVCMCSGKQRYLLGVVLGIGNAEMIKKGPSFHGFFIV